MSLSKKLLIGSLMVSVLVPAFVLTASSAHAAALTDSQIQSILLLLQSFGAPVSSDALGKLLLGSLLFFALKKAGFVKIEERDAKAETLIL